MASGVECERVWVWIFVMGRKRGGREAGGGGDEIQGWESGRRGVMGKSKSRGSSMIIDATGAEAR